MTIRHAILLVSGLIPLCAIGTLEPEMLGTLPRFNCHLTWYPMYHLRQTRLVSHWQKPDASECRLLVRGHHLHWGRRAPRMQPYFILSAHNASGQPLPGLTFCKKRNTTFSKMLEFDEG